MTDLATDVRLLTGGRAQRAASFRFDLLDKSNSHIGTLQVETDPPPRITNSINRAIKRQLSGLVLPPSVTADINTLTDRVKPWARFEDGSEYPMGVFLFADASRRLQLSAGDMFAAPGLGYVTEGNCLDQLATISQGSRGVVFYAPGHLIADAITAQLEQAGVPEFTVDASTAKLAQWVVWKPNANRLKIINDLARMGGYYSLYFDNSGIGRVRQVPNLDAVEPVHVYDAGSNVFADTIVESDDLLDAPNTYVVVNSAFTDFPVFGEWQVPASAPHSYNNRGFHVVKEFDIQGIESNAEAAKAARAQGQADYATYRWADFGTALNPLHDTFDIVSWSGDKYREQQWEATLAPDADMTHELRRVWSETVAEQLLEAA